METLYCFNVFNDQEPSLVTLRRKIRLGFLTTKQLAERVVPEGFNLVVEQVSLFTVYSLRRSAIL